MTTPSTQPLAAFEYEVSDEMATEAALAYFDVHTRKLKKLMQREGMPTTGFPLIVASATLVFAMGLSLFWAADSTMTWVLVPAGVLVLLLLAFKGAVYFVPPFARWFVQRRVVRDFRKYSHRTIRWRFYEDRIETESAAGPRTISWPEIRHILQAPGFWFLKLESGLQLTIPTTVVSADVEGVIKRKGSDAGAVFKDARVASDPELQ